MGTHYATSSCLLGGAGDSGRGWAERYLIKVRNVPAFMQKVVYEPMWDKAGGGGTQKMLDDHVVKEKRQPRVFLQPPKKAGAEGAEDHRTQATGCRQKWSGPC